MRKDMIGAVTKAMESANDEWWHTEPPSELGLMEFLSIAAIKAMDVWRFQAAGITQSPQVRDGARQDG